MVGDKGHQITARRIPVWAMIVAVMLVIGVAGSAYYFLYPLDGPIPDDVGVFYTGLERGYTDQGFPRLGNPNAPVLVEDFSSYACPHCGDFHRERFPDLLDEIAAGTVQFVFIPVTNIGSGARDAAKGAFCAGEQGRYWEMHDVLFDWQERFIMRPFAERRIQKGAENMGLDVDAFKACMDDNHLKAVIDAAKAEFRRRGLTGTPSFFINGQKVRDYGEFKNLGDLAG
ncbi:MAG: DsbA family protein [Anaerolineae bacterium]|nr:DsbA family protein [Anaerolineae bacterium]